MIFNLNGNISDKSYLTIKMSLGSNFSYISKEMINKNSIKININKKILCGSLKLRFELNKEKGKNLFVGKKFSIDYESLYRIIYNNKKYKYVEELSEYSKNNEIEVKFILLSSKLQLQSLFENCKLLKSISGNIKLDNNYSYNLSKMFSNCSSL